MSVTILQHSLERKHPLNSARIAKLGLRNVTVDTVSEINFDARFVIRLLEPGVQSSSDPKRWESSDFDQVLETKETQKRKLEEVDGFSSSREEDIGNSEFKRCVSNECVTEKGSSAMGIPCTLNEAMLGDDKTDVKHVMQEPVITAAIGKYGVISDLHNIWMPQIQWRKRPNFDQILASQVVVDDLEKGFTVKKLQKRQLNGSVKLEEYEEFELRIPSGSVLLYPSDKAVGVDDLKAMNFEVKNLIVLDGTWSKAGRLYNENPWLRVLPHLKLDLDKLSLYSEVRHQPKAGCLSTIESIVYALKALGDNPEGLDNLLDVFESMVADQRRCKDERLNKLSPV